MPDIDEETSQEYAPGASDLDGEISEPQMDEDGRQVVSEALTNAIEDSGKHLSISETAFAIVKGLSEWGDTNQQITKLLIEIATHSSDPIEVYNKSDDHR